MSSTKSSPSQANNINVNRLIQVNNPLPEQWTLVKEWHIEKRSPFEGWRSLANTQIAQMYEQMKTSIEEHPNALLR